MTSKTLTTPRTEAGRHFLLLLSQGLPRKEGDAAEQIAAIEAEAAEPYRRVVEAARELTDAIGKRHDVYKGDHFRYSVPYGSVSVLLEALAALDNSEAERE